MENSLYRSNIQLFLGNKYSPLVLGLFIRLIIFCFICFFPIPFGVGAPISPFHYGGLDLWLYKELIRLAGGNEEAIAIFITTYWNAFLGITPEVNGQMRYPGPVLPLLMWLTDYSPGNTFFLATIIFLLEGVTYCFWQRFITDVVGVPLSYFFSILPQTLWFGLIISSDIFYYSFSSIVIILLLKGTHSSSVTIILFTILAVLSRPVGVGLPIFVILLTLLQNRQLKKTIKETLPFAIIIFFAMIYYYPYLITERFNFAELNTVKNFIETHDIFVNNETLNYFIEKTISFFFLFGVHPSENEFIWAFIIRFIFAICFLIGLARMIIKKDILIFYTLILIVPILLMFYPAWRYLLPIIPILFLHFLLFASEFIKKLIFNK